jgi:hypothetical protein
MFKAMSDLPRPSSGVNSGDAITDSVFTGATCRPDGRLYIAQVTPELLQAAAPLRRSRKQHPDLDRRCNHQVAVFTGFVNEVEGLIDAGWHGGELSRAQLERVVAYLERVAAPRYAWYCKHKRPWCDMPEAERAAGQLRFCPPGSAAPQPEPEPVSDPEPEPQREPEPAPRPDEITLAFDPDGGTLAKSVFAGRVLAARHLLHYRWAALPVGSLEDLLRAVEEAAGLGAFALRGRPLAPVGRRAFKDDPVKGPAGLEAVPRRWAALDWEGFTLPGVDPLDGEAVARALLPYLPPEMACASLIWQATASAGVKQGIRLRTWHFLDRALSTAELKVWLAPLYVGEGPMIDPSTLENVQPIYLGVIGGPEVPRFGILPGESGTVAVPAIKLPEARARPARRAGDGRTASGPRTRPDPGSRARSRRAGPRMRKLVHECLVKIRAARGQEGQRLNVFKHEAARARRLAEMGGMSLAHCRRPAAARGRVSL